MTKSEDLKEGNQSVIVFKAWHFAVSQMLLFIALFTAINMLGTNFDKKYYPIDKGIALEKSVGSLDITLRDLNKTLIDLRVMFAKEEGRQENINITEHKLK